MLARFQVPRSPDDVKSPVREYRPPGSVRRAPGNRRPYLDTPWPRGARAHLLVKDKKPEARGGVGGGGGRGVPGQEGAVGEVVPVKV